MYLQIGTLLFEICSEVQECESFFNQPKFKPFHVVKPENGKKVYRFIVNEDKTKSNRLGDAVRSDYTIASDAIKTVCHNGFIINELLELVEPDTPIVLLQETALNSSKCYVNSNGTLLYIYQGAVGVYQFNKCKAILYWKRCHIKNMEAINRAFYDFFTGCMMHDTERNRLFFHSSGAVINGKSYLLCARSGGGKLQFLI